MAHKHPACPALTLGRDKPCDHPHLLGRAFVTPKVTAVTPKVTAVTPFVTQFLPIKPETAVSLAIQLADMGFRGLYAFHWFSDPTTARPWVDDVVDGIRHEVKTARFLLWTNGKNIQKPEWWKWVSGFDRIFISNYDGFDWHLLQEMCGSRLFVWQDPVFEPLMRVPPNPDAPASPVLCRRPFTEFTITRDGDVHLCCQAWRPEQRIGNVFADGLESCVRTFQRLRAQVALGAEPLSAGHICHGCARPTPEIGTFEPQIAAETVKELGLRE